MRHVALAAAVLALALSGCSSEASEPSESTPDAPAATTGVAASAKAVCPPAWRAAWQKLANEVRIPVYCPSWMPEPLDGKMGSATFNGRFVNDRREYLVSWAWLEPSAVEALEVHVNLRGYPGRTAIPTCEDTLTVKGKTTRTKIPCFSDLRGTKNVAGKRVSVYTANQGTDLWHILYAWRERGSLYTLSEHVAPPYTYDEIMANLDRMMQGLERVPPSS